jgi:hypothetical protein
MAGGTTENTGDVGGVEMTISKGDLVRALLPQIIQELQTNTVLQNALANALMPGIRTQIAQIARSTVSSGTTTGNRGANRG